MYKHFDNIGNIFSVNFFLSPDFAKCRPCVTEPFYTDACTDEIYPDTNTDEKNSPNVIYLVLFCIRIRNADNDDTETWKRGLIRGLFHTMFGVVMIKLIRLAC